MRYGLRMALLLGCVHSWTAVARAEGGAPFPLNFVCHQAAIEAFVALEHSNNGQPTKARSPSRIVIIIDDLGYNLKHGQLATKLPGAVTLAVLPHSPHGRALAELAYQQGKQVMLHAPMSNLSGRPLDKGALIGTMDRRTFMSVLREDLRSLPHVSGVNNHMGSLLTQEKRPMQWLMGELKSRRLYFVDSRTSAASVARTVARERGVASLERDFFLDNNRDCRLIARQFARFMAQARRLGQSVAIAHPHRETLSFLAAAIPMLQRANIQLVSASQLMEPTIPPRPPLDGPPDYVGRLQPNRRQGDKGPRQLLKNSISAGRQTD